MAQQHDQTLTAIVNEAIEAAEEVNDLYDGSDDNKQIITKAFEVARSFNENDLDPKLLETATKVVHELYKPLLDVRGNDAAFHAARSVQFTLYTVKEATLSKLLEPITTKRNGVVIDSSRSVKNDALDFLQHTKAEADRSKDADDQA